MALVSVAACTPRQAVLALLPHADLAPPRDPLVSAAPAQPPPELARVQRAGRVAVPGAGGAKLDVPTSAAAAALILFAGMAPMFGGFGAFEEVELLAPSRRASGATRTEEASEDLRDRGRGYAPVLGEPGSAP